MRNNNNLDNIARFQRALTHLIENPVTSVQSVFFETSSRYAIRNILNQSSESERQQIRSWLVREIDKQMRVIIWGVSLTLGALHLFPDLSPIASYALIFLILECARRIAIQSVYIFNPEKNDMRYDRQIPS